MLFVLDVAFGVFGSNPISGFLHGVIACLPLVFIAIVIIVITAAIAAAVKHMIGNSLGGMPYANVLGNLAWGFILALGIIAAVNQLHIAPNVLNAVLYAALAALAGIAIVAVGEAASRQCPSGGRLPQPDSTRKCCASAPSGTRPALLTRQARPCPPIRAAPPTEQPAQARRRPSPTPSQTRTATTPPAPGANLRKIGTRHTHTRAA
jgi:hypothetical protein